MSDARGSGETELDAAGYDLPGRPPRLVRLYIRQCLIGFALAAVFVGLLLGFDVARLRSLILATQGGWIAAALLFLFNGLVFAGVQFAITVMRMGEAGAGGGRREAARRVLRPDRPEAVRVKAAGPQRPWSA